MGAERTGLKKYQGASGVVYAAKVSEVTPFFGMNGAKTLRFEDSKKKVNLIPDWVAANNPSVGGYFLAEDVSGNTICRFMEAAAFDAQYQPA